MMAAATTARRLTIPTLALLGVLVLPGPSPLSDPGGDWERLRAMPPERRRHLADQLKAFDLLERTEQDAIRALDRKIASESEENRSLYYAVLRRYHLWVQGLPEPQRAELNAAPPSKRFALVSKLLSGRTGTDQDDPLLDHYADFGVASPFVMAQQIATWLKLPDAEKSEVLKLSEPERSRRMDQHARERKVQIPRPSPSEIDALFKRALESGRAPYSRRAEEIKKKSDATKKQSALKHRFVESYYFVEHPPARVNADKLLDFDRALPVWIRAVFDTLPPEETRRRLTILYRLVASQGDPGTS
ncbi:MAG: hypothetical protein LC745_11675, partial [Planctomycetia bacterium]|nr:hypothetical protein [Planctomycetia bacterium]